VLTFQRDAADTANVIRNGTLYFPYVKLNASQSACLHINFSTRSYFAVKVLYEIGYELKQILLFRTETMHDDGYQDLRITLNSSMTEGEPFVVAIDVRTSDEIGTFAVIQHLRLTHAICPTGG
jgi:hypothetical protein